MVTVLVQCNGEAKEAKEQIISLLGQDFPLTAKKLYNLMKKHYMTGTTYHAIYKHLNELVRRGVVTKEGVEYRLSGKWIENLNIFAGNLNINYSVTSDFITDDSSGKVKTLEFNTPREFDEFLMKFRKQFIETSPRRDKNEIYFIGDHTWGPLMNMRQRIDEIRVIKKRGIKYCILIRGSFRLDEYMAKFYKKAGVELVKFGVDRMNNEIITIYNDVVIKVIYPKSVTKNVNKIFSRSKSVEDFDMMELVDKFYNTEGKFIVLLIKDKKFADEQKKAMDSHFEVL